MKPMRVAIEIAPPISHFVPPCHEIEVSVAHLAGTSGQAHKLLNQALVPFLRGQPVMGWPTPYHPSRVIIPVRRGFVAGSDAIPANSGTPREWQPHLEAPYWTGSASPPIPASWQLRVTICRARESLNVTTPFHLGAGYLGGQWPNTERYAL